MIDLLRLAELVSFSIAYEIRATFVDSGSSSCRVSSQAHYTIRVVLCEACSGGQRCIRNSPPEAKSRLSL
jgi:hypothetical protein